MVDTRRALKVAARPDIVRRSLVVSLIVGTVLVAINHGDLILSGGIGRKELIKILLTYIVPYCVSTFSAVAVLERDRPD